MLLIFKPFDFQPDISAINKKYKLSGLTKNLLITIYMICDIFVIAVEFH